MIYFTADWHDGHANIIRYCERPYPDIEAMRAAFVQLYHDRVREGDTVYMLGDMSLKKERVFELLPLIPQGGKMLIVGNHDACWNFWQQPSRIRIREEYLHAGFTEVLQHTQMTVGGREWYLSHLPPQVDIPGTFPDERYEAARPAYDPDLVYLHGHRHTATYIKWRNLIDVGIDGEFCLYSLDDILSIVEDHRALIVGRRTRAAGEPPWNSSKGASSGSVRSV